MASSSFLALLDGCFRLALKGVGRPAAKRGVLFVRSGGLGDTVLFSHLLPRYMEFAGEGEPVAVLTPAASVKTTFLFPETVEIIAVDYRRFKKSPAYRWRMSRALYARAFRAVVSTDHLRHPLADEALIAACRAEECIAMEARSWPKHDRRLRANRRFFTRLFEAGPETLHMYLRWNAFADRLTGRGAAPPLPVIAADRLAPPAPAARPYIVIQPFSALKKKQPPAELFRRIVEAARPGHDVILTGGADDLQKNPDYAFLLEAPGVRFDPAPFAKIVPVLRGARLVVSVDTALMHLAVACRCPTLCLASAAYVGELVPYPAELTPENVRFIYHSMPCEGCRAACTLPAEDGMFPCVARLDRDAVLATVRDMLSRRP